VLGNTRSGVDVAKMMRSMSVGAMPAAAIARQAACSARSQVVSPGEAMCRCRIPVRSVIHASDVSTIFSRSALVSTRSGR
jgi:hypothetical protein